MRARSFRHVGERIGDNYRSVVRLTCAQCGATESIPIATQSRGLPDAVVIRKFQQKNWELGANERRDYCPSCVEKRRPKPVLKVVEEQTPKAEPPRVMTRDDRRIIFAKLSEVYLDEKRGYEQGWSDQKVATDLGIPRKWVEDIRKENFGDIGTNEDMAQFQAEASAMLAEARKVLLLTQTVRDEINTSLKKLEAPIFADIRDKLARIERLGHDIQKLMP